MCTRRVYVQLRELVAGPKNCSHPKHDTQRMEGMSTGCYQTTENQYNNDVALNNLFTDAPHAECIVIKV